jgi:membrane carboxypeptidase/penicillin-binding protein
MTSLRDSIVSAASKVLNVPLRCVALLFVPDATKCLHAELKRALKQHENIPGWEKFAEALVMGEDLRFFSHRGVDVVAIIRAAMRIAIYGERQGASTIEQQLVRTLTGDYRRSLSRKVKEALLASTLWGRVDKMDILKSYLAVAHFGAGVVGLGAATVAISTPRDFEHCRAAHVISHLRYPLPRCATDAQNHRRARRAKVIADMISSGKWKFK